VSQISAAQVKAFRDRTGLPMMDCKNALAEAGGDEDKAIKILREKGKQLGDKRSDRETAFGRMGLYVGEGVASMVELMCESQPVANNEEFRALAADLAKQLATGPGAATAEELLAQPSPGKKGSTLGEQKDELFNRIREVFNVGRLVRIDGKCGAYEHNGTIVHGVLVEATGGTPEQLKDICMHVAAMSPAALDKDSLDPKVIQDEREILRSVALSEGKPASIVDKMVEGRMKNFFAERTLTEQPFVKDDKVTVGQFAKNSGFDLKQFVHWKLGQK
jgi:elongation factor Ts